MSSKNRINPKTIKEAIERIKRRKNIRESKDINITMIAKEVGCSRNTLYDIKFNKILDIYKKIKKSSKTTNKFTYGSKDYYKECISKKNEEIKNLKIDINSIKDKIIDYQILLNTISILEDKNKELEEKIYSEDYNDKIALLESENKRLREKFLKAGFKR